MKPTIEVSHVSKKYKIGESKSYVTLRDEIAELFEGNKNKKQDVLDKDEFWALKDVSFSIHSGEIVGILGRNGAGKSTILKILCRITPPSQGIITLRGTVASLLDVGTGFQSELTGRENIYLNGAILGMRRSDVKEKFDEIVAFSELEKFLDTPFKYYSSGMFVRLGFAIAAHLKSEILIFDEVLAASDAAFQKKSIQKMKELQKQGRTIIFVSHNMNFLKSLCKRVIYFKKGLVFQDGEADEVIHSYMQKI